MIAHASLCAVLLVDGVTGSGGVGFAGGKALAGSLLCWVDFPSGVVGRPSGEDFWVVPRAW